MLIAVNDALNGGITCKNLQGIGKFFLVDPSSLKIKCEKDPKDHKEFVESRKS